MRRLEDRLYVDRRLNGVVFATIGVSAAIGARFALRAAVARTLSTTIATTIFVAGRVRDTEARTVDGESYRQRQKPVITAIDEALDRTAATPRSSRRRR